MRYSKIIVSLVITLNVLFAIGVLFVFNSTGNEPVTLITCWFAFTVGELWMLAGIKKNKNKNNKGD